MQSRFSIPSIIDVALQLLIIAAAVQISYIFNQSYDIIPNFILRVPEFYTSGDDLRTILLAYISIHFAFAVFSQYRNGDSVFFVGERFGREYLIYLIAYTSSSLYVFTATTSNYDPQLFAAIGVFSTIGYLLAFLTMYCFKNGMNLLGGIAAAVTGVFRYVFSLRGILVLAYFIFPLILAKAYTSNRDVANIITQIRIFFNPAEETEFGLNNGYPTLALSQPMLVQQPPLEDDSLYILERNGRILKVNYPTGSEFEVVLDFTHLLGEVEIENGALGFAFHPEFGVQGSDNAGYMYAHYTDNTSEGQVNRISRFDISAPTMSARLASETTLMALNRNDEGFHNGGSIEFGPDGYLYIGMGEGVHPLGVIDSAEVMRSGMLRIDIDLDNTAASQAPSSPPVNGVSANYLVPRDNPFVNNDAVMDEYWALGLRNPFRFSFDPETGDLWLGDVGTTVWEEVNVIEKGKNYQFPYIEGRALTGIAGPQVIYGEEQGPVYTYEHTAYDRAVIGGVVYRGNKYPQLVGNYIFADNYSSKIFLLTPGQNVTDPVEEVTLIARGAQFAQRGVSSLTQLRNGDIVVSVLGASSEPSGEILQLVPADEVTNPSQVSESSEGSGSGGAPREYDSAEMRELFNVNCSRCHGTSGDGNSPDASALGVPLPDFTSAEYQQSRSDEEIHSVIYDGGPSLGLSPLMPPWGEFLAEQEVDFLTRYIRELGAQN